MALATMTTKGQVTIPKEVRESLGLHSGDKIEFVLNDDKEVLIRPVSKKVDEIYGKLRRAGRRALSTAEMDEAIRKKMKDNL